MMIDDMQRQRAQEVAEGLLREIHGARSVLVATADGFDLASAGQADTASRLAAMTSSIAAIGEVVSQETSLGRPSCLVVDAENGFLLVRATSDAGVPLVLNVLTSRVALLGMAMHVLNAVARRLEARGA